MRVARDVAGAAVFGPSVVAIGNFDGVHAGHRALLRAAVDLARQRYATPAVLTFDPHPACVVAPDRAPRLLYSFEERCAELEGEGIEAILILPFNMEVARLTPEEFVSRILSDGLRTVAVVVGENFRFGYKQSGDAAALAALGARYGFECRTLPAVTLRGLVVSASEVRKRIESGEAALAARLLGRPYALSGVVIHGHGIGAKQTVPTLNLETEAQILPARGVYITRTQDLDAGLRWNSLTNIGVRPTFGGDLSQSIETYLLDSFDGATPHRIRVEFLHRVREERKFESAEVLKAQILRDARRAQGYYRRVARWVRML
jgi:riboflavin kinase/FMN adenylyltransferase